MTGCGVEGTVLLAGGPSRPADVAGRGRRQSGMCMYSTMQLMYVEGPKELFAERTPQS